MSSSNSRTCEVEENVHMFSKDLISSLDLLPVVCEIAQWARTRRGRQALLALVGAEESRTPMRRIIRSGNLQSETLTSGRTRFASEYDAAVFQQQLGSKDAYFGSPNQPRYRQKVHHGRKIHEVAFRRKEKVGAG